MSCFVCIVRGKVPFCMFEINSCMQQSHCFVARFPMNAQAQTYSPCVPYFTQQPLPKKPTFPPTPQVAPHTQSFPVSYSPLSRNTSYLKTSISSTAEPLPKPKPPPTRYIPQSPPPTHINPAPPSLSSQTHLQFLASPSCVSSCADATSVSAPRAPRLHYAHSTSCPGVTGRVLG